MIPKRKLNMGKKRTDKRTGGGREERGIKKGKETGERRRGHRRTWRSRGYERS